MNIPQKYSLYLTAFVAGLVGFLFGAGVTVISGTLASLQADWKLEDSKMEMIVSALLWGAALIVPASGFLSNKIGRKKTMLLGTLLFIIGSLACAWSFHFSFLIGARFLFGIGIGMMSFSTPIYISEISPQKKRGTFIALYFFLMAFGMLTVFLSNAFIGGKHFTTLPFPLWRLMLGIISVPGLLIFFILFFLEESPHWLFLKGFHERALSIFKKIGHSEEQVSEEQKDLNLITRHPQQGIKLLLKSAPFRKVIALGSLLQTLQQLTGINVVMYYAPLIFKMAGFGSSSDQLGGTVFIGLANLLSTIIALLFIDHLGRRIVLFFGYGMMIFSFLIMGFLLNSDLHQKSFFGVAAITALLLFVFSFGMSSGPVTCLLCAEIFPLSGRDLATIFSSTIYWIVNAIVGGTALTLFHWLGNGNTFLFYATLQFFSLFFISTLVPETKNISLKKIEMNLFSGMPLRKIGR